MKIEQPIRQATKEAPLARRPVVPEKTSGTKEYSQRLLVKARQQGPDILRQCTAYAKQLDKEFAGQGGRDYLIRNPYYHVLIGSSPWPGLELSRGEEVSSKIKDFINNL